MNKKLDNWEEVPHKDLFENGELTNEKAMIKAWDNVYYGIYKFIRRIQ
jgi:hypothetical protein